MNLISKRSGLFIAILAVFFTFFGLFTTTINAQGTISLSISPPLFEAIVKPGKEVKQIYTITNNGGDTLVSPKIVYFLPEDENGNVSLTEDEAPEWIMYDKNPFNLKFGESKQFNVLISPPEGIDETDHFVTLTFESAEPVDILNQNALFYKSKIGSNILITISNDGNPKKSAEVVNFTAPKIIDSYFGKIKYDLTIRNNGNSFWKPVGKIIFNDKETLKLASLNVISGSNRKISCIENETLKECEVKSKIFAGKVKSNLEFTIDEEPTVYKKEIITYVFPFTYLAAGLILLTLIRLRGIFKVWAKRR